MSVAAIEPLVKAGTPERRLVTFDTQPEIRQEGDSLKFVGHAAVFDRLSEDLGGFRERIQRGAFRKVLDSNPDVRFLALDHSGLPLARTAAGTMELSEDPRGLRVYADLAPIQASRDLKVLIQRGDLSQMSFGFTIGANGRDVWSDEDGQVTRTIVSFGAIYDVSPVAFPAYQSTDVSMRSAACGVEIVAAGAVQEAALRAVAEKIHRGEQDATEEERGRIDAAFARLDTVSPWIAERALRAVSQEPELRAAIPGKVATVVIEDADVGEVAYRLAARRRRLRALGVQVEARTDAAIVHLLRTMVGLANQYLASPEKDEGDDDTQTMQGVLADLNDLLTDELAEPS
jgi:HK97 family phage prohead protease